jgi:hypothetical protein
MLRHRVGSGRRAGLDLEWHSTGVKNNIPVEQQVEEKASHIQNTTSDEKQRATNTTDDWMPRRDDRDARRYHTFSSFGFFGFSARRFKVAVITTLAFTVAPGLTRLSETPVRSAGAEELDPKSEFLVTNIPHATFFWLLGANDRTHQVAFSRELLHARSCFYLDETDNGSAAGECGLSGYYPGWPAAPF